MKKFTKTERLVCQGLLTLAEKHYNALDDVMDSLREITGDSIEKSDFVGDVIYGEENFQVDNLLEKFK